MPECAPCYLKFRKIACCLLQSDFKASNEDVLALIGATSEVKMEVRFRIYSKFYVKYVLVMVCRHSEVQSSEILI